MRLPLPAIAPLLLLLACVACVLPAPAGAAAVAEPASASIGAVDCARGGAVVTLANPGSGAVRATIWRGGTRVGSTRLAPATAPIERVVPIAAGVSDLVVVRVGDRTITSSVRGTCLGARGAGELLPTTGAAPVAQVRSAETVEVTEPFGGHPLVLPTLVALGAMLVASALLLVRSRRRGETPRRAPAARRRA